MSISPLHDDPRLARLTPQQLALLRQRLAAGAAPQVSLADAVRALPPLADGTPLPQSPAQQRMWFFERLQPGTGAYHLYQHCRLSGALDAAALEAAFAAIVARHAALRTGFGEEGGQPLQTVAPHAPFTLQRLDLSQLDFAAAHAAALDYAGAETQRPFDLARPPLLRASLVTLAPQEYALVVVLHHIIADAWSLNVLYGELQALYRAHASGAPSPLAPLPLAFPEIVRWQASPPRQAALARQVAFWHQALDGCSGLLELPADAPRGPSLSPAGERHAFVVPPALSHAVKALAQAEGATLFMALLSAFQVLLARLASQDDVVVGTPVANRGAPESEPLIGLFVNTLALRADLSDDPAFTALLARNRQHFLDALAHAEAPLERIVDGLRIERVPGRSTLFQTMFVLQAPAASASEEAAQAAWHGLRPGPFEPPFKAARFEITLSMMELDGALSGVIDYSVALFEPATIARMAEQFTQLLAAIVQAPATQVSRLDLLPAAQRAQLLALGDGGAHADGQDLPDGGLYALVARQAALTPQAAAIVDDGVELSYAQLHAAATALAARLQAAGAGPGRHVALLADRSADALVGLLAIVATGAAYVPLDPALPAARLRFMLDDAGAVAIVAPPAAQAQALAIAGQLPVLANGAPPDGAAFTAPAIDGSTPAYLIYTSGSTGTPKGVSVSQANVLHLLQGFAKAHDLAGQRLLMIPPLQFDASVGDIFPALASGATLVLHGAPNQLGAAELAAYCARHAVTAIDAPAALWRRWTDAFDGAASATGSVLPGLRLMMFGGEAVPVEQVRRFARLTGKRVRLVNHYGPTEATVCATTFSTVDGAGLEGSDLPIGQPLPGVRAYVLDRHQRLAPRGVAGELAIGGAGVAAGYRHAPALTAERFVADPYCGQEHGRMYRSGDLARWNSDGSLQFLGRRDHQVKLRGVRIELGEVESALLACDGVQAAVATVLEVAPGDKRLVAYFVGPGVTGAALRADLAARLPDAMLPAIFERLQALPLTGNGKIDRRALPAPTQALHELEARSIVAPATDTEQRMLAVWQELLGRAGLSTDDEFFSVGGDSLLTLPLVFQLARAFGVDVPLTAVFSAPSIAALSRVVDDLLAGVAAPVLDLATQAVLPPDIDAARAAPRRAGPPRAILVTGATGFLGAWLLRDLLDASAAQLLCLVRADDAADGARRLRANLQHYGLWQERYAARLTPLPGDLAAPRLGLTDDGYATVASEADAIVHNGGQVNFLAPYASLAPANVGGTLEVLRLATTGALKAVHVVSTLGVYVSADYLGASVRESDAPPTAHSQQGGYNQSKWVAEQLALAARGRGVPVALYRPARITGDSGSGSANLGDYFSSWIKGCAQLGLVPDIANASYDMAPVDHVSAVIAGRVLADDGAGGTWHFLNPARLSTGALVDGLRAAGHPVRLAGYAEWRAALQRAVAGGEENALASFAALFPEQADAREPGFDCGATERMAAALGQVCPPADGALFATYLAYMHGRDYLPLAGATPQERACA